MKKTSKGQFVDMDKLRIQNERTVAAGNMKVNAKGDELGRGGKIVKKSKEKTEPYYKGKKEEKTISLKKPVTVKEDALEIDSANIKEETQETMLENGDIVVTPKGRKKK